MNTFKPSFHELNYGIGEASSSSETSSSSHRIIRTSHSDEEVILASARPKKRAGRRVFNETRHPVYRGVRRRNKNKWVCEMRVPNNNSRIWLGTYPTPEMAARAHDVAALALRGKSACLNFADSLWRLPLPASTCAEDIRRAAVEAAESFAAEDSQHHLKQSAKVTSVDYEVCSVGDNMVVEDANDKPLQQERIYVDEVPAASELEDLHELLLSIADEPLMSPPPCARDGWGWNDVEIFDAEVSLWNFSM
ncbi:dehydration-responsive element-binding protein 1E-like [Abrus precatorius]|uniref:Dehydration-responsive element-binding protein 1E-like n=1 Tax=Abrus precatorius TaxID=3816 RepID=A0A8B8M449_ABRPR|nr:dehydration-responsive element-binding protein 1E-like [Abrus precatorius]